MSNVIQATRPEVSRTFPLPGFRIRTNISPAWGEVAVATSPQLLFDPAARERRTPHNFYSSRSEQLFPLTRGEAVYLLPPGVMNKFAGQPRLYYAVAIYPQPNLQNPQVTRVPLEAVPYVNISSSFRGEQQGILGVPNARGGLTGNGYSTGNHGSLEWGGDVAPAGEMVTMPAPGNGATVGGGNGNGTAVRNGGNGTGTATRNGGNGNGSAAANGGNGGTPAAPGATAEQAGLAIAYDDGFDPKLWHQPQASPPRAHAQSAAVARSLSIVRPDYVPSNWRDAITTLRDFVQRYARWRAGVPDTRFFPHSAICQMVMTFPDGNYIGTGFYIGRDRILTCAHNVKDVPANTEASSIVITPGKNGSTAPFGSFTVRRAAWEVHPSYDGSFDFDLAVIRVTTPPPNGFYFDVLEDLRQSIPEQIIVCGYAAQQGDENKQNLDGDTVRGVSDNLERIQYNLQTEPGNSGSPVFYMTGFEDPVQQMSVPVFPIIGVHVSGFDESRNQACRLSQAKINWINSVGSSASSAQAFGGVYSARRTRAFADEPADYGIDGPIPDDEVYGEGQRYSAALSGTPEYPDASQFIQARWYRATSGQRTIRRVVIHITDGGARRASGTANYFSNPGDGRRVSAHYVIGQDGDVIQMVKHNDVAWHASSANGDSIGIEHQANTRGMNLTEQQYCLSAALVRWLCEQYNIPMDRTHILGHSEADPNTSHTGCPNALWNWDYFMGMVTSGSCYPMSQAAQAFQQAGQSAPSPFNADAVDSMRQEFVANVQQGSPQKCIVITNTGLRALFGDLLKNPDGSNKRLGSTIQDTMGALQRYSLAGPAQEFEFNNASGTLTRGVVRPHALRQSVEQWLLAQAEANQMSAWYVFGLSIMDGYHSVVLGLQFSGTGHPDTRLFWADQIFSGWDDITGGLDDRITDRTQRWWDPLAQNKKPRTRVTVWPLQLPLATGSALTANGYDDIEGDEEEPESMAYALQRSASEIQACVNSCTDDFCPANPATTAGSAHFTLEEFRCRDGTAVPERFRGNVQRVMDNLEVLRAELGNSPITITSGYRTCAYNCTLSGSAPQSRHLCGQAADIQVAGYTPEQVFCTIERLIREGRMHNGGMGLYPNFVHYDVRATPARWPRARVSQVRCD